MNSDRGYILLYRSLYDHWLWSDKPFSKAHAWIDLLLMVNHEDKTILMDGAPVEVKRGMTITSVRKLADRWGWSRAKVTKFLKDLERESMIICNFEAGKKTTINIVNYDIYQDSQARQKASEKPVGSHSKASEKPKQYTNKYTSKYTKEKKDPASYEAPPPEDEVGKPWEGVEWL